MRIKEVEELVNISKKNIRFYEQAGLLRPGREVENRYRDYTEDDIRRLRIIRLLRKLNMPISSISDVLEERISLHDALHLHALLLEEQRGSIVNAQRICRQISKENPELYTLDTEKYLEEITKLEDKSTELVDLRSKDTGSRYREIILISAVVFMILLVFAAVILLVFRRGMIPSWMLYLAGLAIVLMFASLTLALHAVLKELRGKDDANSGF